MTQKLKEPLEYLLDATTDWLNIFPWFGRGMKEFVQRMTKVAAEIKPGFQPTTIIESMPFEVLGRITYSGLTFADAIGHFIAGEDEKAAKMAEKGFWQLVKSTGLLFGIPTYQIQQLWKGWIKEEEPEKGALRAGESIRGRESIRE